MSTWIVIIYSILIKRTFEDAVVTAFTIVQNKKPLTEGIRSSCPYLYSVAVTHTMIAQCFYCAAG